MKWRSLIWLIVILLWATPALCQQSGLYWQCVLPSSASPQGTFCPVSTTYPLPEAPAASSSSSVGLTPQVSASAENNHVLKAAGGNLYGVYAVNLTATAGFLVLLNAASAPGDGAITPLVCVPLPANGIASVSYNPGPPAVFSAGITAVVTSASTCFTKTTGTITAYIGGAAS